VEEITREGPAQDQERRRINYGASGLIVHFERDIQVIALDE
jgi:hypothetical protein